MGATGDADASGVPVGNWLIQDTYEHDPLWPYLIDAWDEVHEDFMTNNPWAPRFSERTVRRIENIIGMIRAVMRVNRGGCVPF
ncbi:hypothetical protein H2199_003192 [Coniosporium tulheliwenetii]|uniref:Uncharacterized protein n=1 Tax=Coniosporium tulheliwenetii TaxID=3383036 RepID=A0ACC2ZBN0_9PEZI|nr:hypothetical protein H2199_003192 [Cladosporium sp. JES 115]